ncbi:hypothetical protein L873DRAFT_1844606 [Choiromyces venosus 120613-1]|uniref:Secreted protein n=1 Tax=Choiromyces venosus 120613-1 TaxID=1336337 RepID=A0A3N4JN14_9PEZI|nr:hypothetical protein L873DRAFT_1844606 [Choiromyces venosus 120613-1]
MLVNSRIIAGVFALSVATTLAADCFGDKGEHPEVAWARELQESMCGTGCALNDQEVGNKECSLATIIKNGTAVLAYRSDPTGQYKNCPPSIYHANTDISKGALDNAITQCFLDKSQAYTGAMKKTQGNWKLGDESYWISIETADQYLYDPLEELSVSVNVDDDPKTPAGNIIRGPNKFCTGLSHGGGDTCIDIPDACLIIVPAYNIIPPIICPDEGI